MKKKSIAGVLVALMGVSGFGAEGNMYGNQAQNEGLDVVPVKGAVKIDGVIDPAEWDLSGQIWSFADWDARDQFSVKTAAMYDKDYLYLSFDWRDPMPLNSTVDPKEDPSHGWQADAIQLRTFTDTMVSWFTMWGYEGGHKPAFHYCQAGDRKNPENKSVVNPSVLLYTGVADNPDLGEGVQLAYRMADDGKGFTQEVRIPWEMVYRVEKRTVKAGETFRMGLEFYWGTPRGTGFPMHNYKDNLQPGVYTREFFWRATKAWGDVRMLAGPAKRREYRPGVLKPEGTIPVRVKVPADREFFSLAILDGEGRHVRNLAGGFRVADYRVGGSGDTAEVEVMWDGRDETGGLVKPGVFTAKALGSDRVDGFWEISFYNPGTPAWDTLDTSGAWGADHTCAHRVARAGDLMICCWPFAEGGHATIALGPDGRKVWGDKRGTDALAANDRYVFISPNDWTGTGETISRMDARTGAYLPYGKGGDMPLSLQKFLKLKANERVPRIVAMALTGRGLVILSDDDALRIVNPDNGDIVRKLTLHATRYTDSASCPFAADDDTVFTFFGRELQVTDLASGKSRLVTLTSGFFGRTPAVERPSAIALAPDGSLLVADCGADMRIKRFDREGRETGAIGRKGGRARQGVFDRDGVREPTSLAFDAQGNLWVTERQDYPRRVSVFAPDGSFVKDYLGNSGYAGHGTMIHRNDPTKACANRNEISLDFANHRWDVSNVMYNPDASKGTVIPPGTTSFHAGDMFYSSASGEKREYYASVGEPRNTPYFIMMRVGENWEPVAAITSVARIQGLIGGMYGAQVMAPTYGEWADCNPADTVVWNDLNNDGYVQREECEILPETCPTLPKGERRTGVARGLALLPASNTTADADDLGVYAQLTTVTVTGEGRKAKRETSTAWGRLLPVAYRDGGRPVYAAKGFRPVPTPGFCVAGAATEVPGEDLVVGFQLIGKKTYVAGWRKSTGELVWKHLSPYHQVHGSHNAPMPRPGLVIGAIKVLGVAKGCGAGKSVFMVRGNLGEDYFFTTDGFLVNRWTKDGRLPGLPPPEDEGMMRKVSYANYNGRGEPFSGNFTRQDDGVIRLTGALPASQAGNVFRIEGLERLKAGGTAAITVDDAAIVKADRFNAELALKTAKVVEPLVIGKDLKKARPVRIARDGQSATADFRAAYDAEKLSLSWVVSNDASPWKNGGKDWRILFKTGDCVDFQLSPTGNRTRTPKDGDFRLLVAPFGGETAVVLMKPVSSGAKAPHTFTSPVQSLRFDAVTRLAAKPVVKVQGGRVEIHLDVAWNDLGMAAPKSGTKLSGDVGFILSDNDGQINVARVYRANASTNLVNDQPGEAQLTPAAFSEVVFE